MNSEVNRLDHLFRREAGKMVATLTRILGLENLHLAEDVIQDALLKAMRNWPFGGIPRNPSAWLMQVAKNTMLSMSSVVNTISEAKTFLAKRLAECKAKLAGVDLAGCLAPRIVR